MILVYLYERYHLAIVTFQNQQKLVNWRHKATKQPPITSVCRNGTIQTGMRLNIMIKILYRFIQNTFLLLKEIIVSMDYQLRTASNNGLSKHLQTFSFVSNSLAVLAIAVTYNLASYL